jgi:hypothetical protein
LGALGGGGGGGNSFLGAVAFLASMGGGGGAGKSFFTACLGGVGGIGKSFFSACFGGGGGGGGGAFLSPSLTICGGVNLVTSTSCFFFLGVLLTVTGMASGPFSTLGLDVWALEKSPIPNRQTAVRARRRFMAFFYIETPNVINSIKPVSKLAKIGSIGF